MFTKVQMSLDADFALQDYFWENKRTVDKWFNVLSPRGRRLGSLRKELKTLASKDWAGVR